MTAPGFSEQNIFDAISNLHKVPMSDEMIEHCRRDPTKAIQVAINRGARWLEVEQSIIDYALNFDNWGFSRSVANYCNHVIGGRWSELEDAVKSQTHLFLGQRHFSLITVYCADVLKGRWFAIEKNIKEPRQIREYAHYVIKGRWVEKEPEILENIDIAREYGLSVVQEKWKEFEEKLLKISPPQESKIVDYSLRYGRWYEAEGHINSPEYIVSYAIGVIGGRWKEKEDIIAKSPSHAFLYAQEVIKGPFPEAEKLLLGSPWYFDYFTFATKAYRSLSYQLAAQFPTDMTVGEVLKIIDDGRNPEFEKKLLSSSRNQSKAVWYAVNILKGRWPEMEEKIKKSAKCAVDYAKYVIKGRWEEAEKYISKNEKYLSIYGVEVIKGKLPDVLHNKILAAAMRNSKERNIKRYFEMLDGN